MTEEPTKPVKPTDLSKPIETKPTTPVTTEDPTETKSSDPKNSTKLTESKPKELPETNERMKQRNTIIIALLSFVGLGGFVTYVGLRKRD